MTKIFVWLKFFCDLNFCVTKATSPHKKIMLPHHKKILQPPKNHTTSPQKIMWTLKKSSTLVSEWENHATSPHKNILQYLHPKITQPLIKKDHATSRQRKLCNLSKKKSCNISTKNHATSQQKNHATSPPKITNLNFFMLQLLQIKNHATSPF